MLFLMLFLMLMLAFDVGFSPLVFAPPHAFSGGGAKAEPRRQAWAALVGGISLILGFTRFLILIIDFDFRFFVFAVKFSPHQLQKMS